MLETPQFGRLIRPSEVLEVLGVNSLFAASLPPKAWWCKHHEVHLPPAVGQLQRIIKNSAGVRLPGGVGTSAPGLGAGGPVWIQVVA